VLSLLLWVYFSGQVCTTLSIGLRLTTFGVHNILFLSYVSLEPYHFPFL